MTHKSFAWHLCKAKERGKTFLILLLLPAAVVQYSQWWHGVNNFAERVQQISAPISWMNPR